MRTRFAKYWPSIVTLAAATVTFLNPAVQAWAGKHSAYSVPVVTIWGLFLHWAESPRQN
jgi:hypothetical protein